MPTEEFENWVYNSSDLESRVGSEFYMDIISVDYSNTGQVYVLKEQLRKFASKNNIYGCACITLADLDDVGMGEHDYVFKNFTNQKQHGELYWWLSIYNCKECFQDWMVAQEERINDVFILKRISRTAAMQIRRSDQWPNDFMKFSTLLRIGGERGHNCRFVELLSPALTHTVHDLALEKPGIGLSEIAELLEIDIEWAKQLALHVLSEHDVRITI